MRTKYLDIVKAIEERVSIMDYALNDLPGERKLAEEFGVSHMTARRAVLHLVEKGVLKRADGGSRIARPPSGVKKKLSIALVMPAFDSAAMQSWHTALSNIVSDREGLVRPVMYVHQSDRAIQEALRSNFTGLFVVPPRKASKLLLNHMVKERNRVVTLWHDLTHLGIPCVEVAPPRFMRKVVEHLVGLGHRVIDCLNTEPSNDVTGDRIAVWQQSLAEFGVTGQLHNKPVEPFERADLAAYAYMRELSVKPLKATAFVCVSTAAAVGVSRACYESNIRLGSDLSVTGWGGMATAKLATPSLTALQPASFELYLSQGLDWIESESKSGTENLHFEPEDVSVWKGESTGPAPR